MLLVANVWWLCAILAIVIWVAIAFSPARLAARKGQSFFGNANFALSPISFPAALIVAYWFRIAGLRLDDRPKPTSPA